jgi:glycosyltransferase involved in cell wall biosynthesis
MKNIFGTIFPFIETTDDSYKLGRHVANFEFFKSLLKSSSFDEFHLFCLNAGHFNTTMKKIQQLGLPAEQMDKVRLFLYPFLIEQIKQTEYHIFHLGGWGYFFPGLVYLRNKYAKNKFPITGLIHSLNGMETPYHVLKMGLAPVLPFDTIICSSNAGKMVLEKTFTTLSAQMARHGTSVDFKGRYEIVPLGFDDDLIQSINKNDARKKLELPEDATILLTLGRFSPSTKMDLYPLLQVQKRLVSSTNKKVFLVIAGNGSGANTKLLQDMIAELSLNESVKVISDFSTDVKPSLYSASDMYVSLSDNLQETFGISVIEAMAFGLPAVVSDINGYKELVHDDVDGYKIPTTWVSALPVTELSDLMNFDTMQLFLAQAMAIDTRLLQEKLGCLIKDESLRKRMGDKGKKRSLETYRWSSIIKQYEALWDKLSKESREYRGKVVVEENLFANDYLAAFSHYPTGILTEKSIITITSYGTECLKTTHFPAAYSDIAPLVPDDLVSAILKAAAKNEITVESLKKQIPLPSSFSLDFAVLWMAKYSLVGLK